MYKLVIQDDEGKTTVVPLIRDELTIGRKEGNTIRLTERNVSRRHAKVYRQNGSISIEDLDSYNGIRVNGSRIQGRVEIKESDRVQIGDYLIEIKSDAAAKIGDNDRTQPIERVDPMGNTPIPEVTGAGAATIKTPMIPVAEGTAPGVPVSARPEPVVAIPDGDSAAVTAPVSAAAQGHARLVVLSTSFAGDEFDLDKPSMVIGRTDDNDICINHRSISRHHAKVVRENGRYAIVDLQSSNGVRVNGEEYGKVELRRADVVDLGHVRLRFVEPGEDFLFGRDAQAVDIAPHGSGRAALWGFLVVLVIAGGVGAFLFTRDKGAADGPTSVGSDSTQVAEPVITPPPASIDAASGVEPTSDADDRALQEALTSADEWIKAEDWRRALSFAEQALALDPASDRALKLKDHAQSEVRAQIIYESLLKCDRDASCAIAQFGKLPAESIYKLRAQEKMEGLKRDATNRYRAAAKKATRLGPAACEAELDRLAREAGRLWSDLRSVVQSHRCPQATAVVTPVEPPGDPDSGSGEDSSANRASAAQLIKEAQEAGKATQWNKALQKCQQALQKKRGDADAIMVCAIASCNLKKPAEARRYVGSIKSDGHRSMARQICLRNGIEL